MATADEATLALCCPDELRMSRKDAELCKALAEAQDWQYVKIFGGGNYDVCVLGRHPKAGILGYIPRYLTDPSETLRMEKELIDYYKEVAFRKTEDGKIIIGLGDLTHGKFVFTKHADHEHAVAEAMLEKLTKEDG